MAKVTNTTPSIAHPAWDVHAVRQMVLLDAHCKAVWEDGDPSRELKANDALSHAVRAGINKVFGVEQVPARNVRGSREALKHLQSCTSSEARVWVNIHLSQELQASWQATQRKTTAAQPAPESGPCEPQPSSGEPPGGLEITRTLSSMGGHALAPALQATPLPGPPLPGPPSSAVTACRARLDWSAWEDATVVELARLHGAKWRKIAGALPGRSDSAVRNRWQRLHPGADNARTPPAVDASGAAVLSAATLPSAPARPISTGSRVPGRPISATACAPPMGGTALSAAPPTALVPPAPPTRPAAPVADGSPPPAPYHRSPSSPSSSSFSSSSFSVPSIVSPPLDPFSHAPSVLAPSLDWPTALEVRASPTLTPPLTPPLTPAPTPTPTPPLTLAPALALTVPQPLTPTPTPTPKQLEAASTRQGSEHAQEYCLQVDDVHEVLDSFCAELSSREIADLEASSQGVVGPTSSAELSSPGLLSPALPLPALAADPLEAVRSDAEISASEIGDISASETEVIASLLSEPTALPSLQPLSPPLSPPMPPIHDARGAATRPATSGAPAAARGVSVADYSIGRCSLEFRCAQTRRRFHQASAAAIEAAMRHCVISIIVPLQLLMSCKVSQEKFGPAFLLSPAYYATLPHEWVTSLCSLLLLVCWKWRARLRIRLSSFSSVVYLSAVAMLTIHQAFLLHRCPHDPQSMSCALAVKVYLHDPDVRAPPRL